MSRPDLRPTAARIAFHLGALPYSARFDVADQKLERFGSAFDMNAAEALLEVLRPSSPGEHAHADAWFARLRATPMAAYLKARWLSAASLHGEAAACWAQFFSLTPCREPLVLLHAARTAAAVEDWPLAAARLRDAFTSRPDYTFHLRAQGLVRQVAERVPALRRARIAVLGSATTSLLVPVMQALAFRDGIAAEWYEGMFGAYRQEILDPDSGLARFSPDITFIVPLWRDLDLPALGSEEAIVEQVVAEHVALWETLARRTSCHIVQHTFDVPLADSAGSLAARPGGRRAILRRINLRLAEAAPAWVSVLDTERVMAEVGAAAWYDPVLWHRARQHPSPRALPVLAGEQIAHVRAVLGLTRKVVVCDLDNTLWGGVIGEDGLNGIRIGPGSPEGEAYLELQKYLKELRARGVLLAVASKNNPDDARLPFTEHPRMALSLDDFAAFEASWDDKVTALRRIAAKLSLGTDSFVFLDDNPLERAWVRSQMPEVAVLELGPSPATFVRDLDSARFFDVVRVSAEDLQRAELYRREAERESLRARAGSLEDFLAGLSMQASCVPVSESNLARATQLVNKTNQFNLTTRRYTEAQVREIAERAGGWTGVFELADRFGDHGIIGLVFCRPGETTKSWEIDTWLMSCRVLGRQMEHFMLDRVIDAARAAGVERLIGVYRPTPKNALVAGLLPSLGFVERERDGDDRRYELAITPELPAYSRFVENVTARSTAGSLVSSAS